jgi:hypothetical protein
MFISARRMAPLAVLMLATTVGCNAFPRVWGINDDDDEPRRWTKEWYDANPGDEIGARQKYKAGRLWPPYPRPTSPQLQCSQRYHAAHDWPFPYNCQDRAYIHEISQRQVLNGWTTETTLLDYHFNDKNELNNAGRMQLKWILQNAPPEHRAAWVQTADTSDISQQRLANVQLAATEMVGPENVPSIALRVATPLGRPAQEIDAIRKAEIGSVPQPRITYQAVGSAASGS